MKLGLQGFVRNDSGGVTVEVQGTSQRTKEFLQAFQEQLPPLASIDSLVTSELECLDESEFSILRSSVSHSESTPVAPDVAMCEECRRELNDTNDRRYRYPFVNCTDCGPRFTIIEDIPYDRPMTTMKSFTMCESCQREYDDPSDRRFHAQPNACPDCGPGIWFVTKQSDAKKFGSMEVGKHTRDSADAAIKEFATAIRNSDVVAVKGIGGFHLACDAKSLSAIAKLRERKGKVEKPLAVMIKSAEAAEAFAYMSAAQRRVLESKERPIVLLRKRNSSEHQAMLQCVAPGNDCIGVMLPYSPLHTLLVDACMPLVMTSGNLSDEPIVRTNAEARERLKELADSFLFHDREINVVCDDSVVRCVGNRILPIRRSRGYSPMPVALATTGPSVLAVGGEIKSAFCVTKGNYAYMSQHIGDVGNLETVDALTRNVEHFLKLFRIDVEAVVADLHPEYLSSRWAQQFAAKRGVPFVRVQHHFAHALSLIGEQRWSDDRNAIMCCFDGTGYGTDQAIWGGEILIANSQEYERFAHLDYFPLPGGDACITHPSRTALALLRRYQIPWDDRLSSISTLTEIEKRVLRKQIDSGFHCASSSSMGRLFDAVASLIGIRHSVSYEAQAAMEMEAMASEVIEDVQSSYEFTMKPAKAIQIGCQSLLESIVRDVSAGVEKRVVAARFHRAVANMICSVCSHARDSRKLNTVGLTGGVFQNALLARLAECRLRAEGFDVLSHTIVPPNDGGLALGQAIAARTTIR